MQIARNMVEDAQGAQGQATGGFQHHPGIEAQVRLCGDERIGVEARVGREVANHRQARLENGPRADGMVEGHLAKAEARLGLEPLSAILDQAHEGHRGVACAGRQTHQIVECGLGRGVRMR